MKWFFIRLYYHIFKSNQIRKYPFGKARQCDLFFNPKRMAEYFNYPKSINYVGNGYYIIEPKEDKP